jgi:ferredoxin
LSFIYNSEINWNLKRAGQEYDEGKVREAAEICPVEAIKIEEQGVTV